MKEDEAKQRWCPFVRIICDVPGANTSMGPFNRLVTSDNPDQARIPPSGTCIGSDCMAWRWKLVDAEDSSLPGLRVHMTDIEGTNIGYCGLAGE